VIQALVFHSFLSTGPLPLLYPVPDDVLSEVVYNDALTAIVIMTNLMRPPHNTCRCSNLAIITFLISVDVPIHICVSCLLKNETKCSFEPKRLCAGDNVRVWNGPMHILDYHT
jgi:hypothetical protein